MENTIPVLPDILPQYIKIQCPGQLSLCVYGRHYFLYSFSALRFYVSMIDSIRLWLQLIPTVGLGFDYIYKELTRKEEYFFYYNQGIGKYQLWIVTFIVMFICCNLLNQIIQLCIQALK